MHVNAVSDQFDRHPRILHQGSDRTRVAVMKRSHRIRQMCRDGGAFLDRDLRHLIVGIGMPDCGNRSGTNDLMNRRDRAGSSGAMVTILIRPPPTASSSPTSLASGARS